MKIVITEPTNIENTKSVGCFFIEEQVRKNGFDIEYINFNDIKDVEADLFLFSVHHVKDIFFLSKMIRYKKGIWIGGGHVMNHPYPFLHFFDLICVGEGEEWILRVLEIYQESPEKDIFIKKATELEGSISLLNLKEPVKKLYINDISINNIYLNQAHSEGHSDTWYIEIARGCKSKCLYCELGWTSHYREKNKDKVFNELDNIKGKKVRKVNIFAPDDFSCSFYNECIQKILDNGLITNFGSMRVDRFKDIDLKVKKNFLFRLGIDGLTETIREKINKKITDNEIVELITSLADKGFVMFKFFMIFSYPFENVNDFVTFRNMLNRIKAHVKNYTRPIFLRLKFTPFIPVPLTPLENFTPHYSKEMRMQIENFFMDEKLNWSNVFFQNDGILEPYSYYTQTFLSRCGYEDINIKMLQNRKAFNFIAESKVKNLKLFNNIQTKISKEKRDEIYEKITGTN